MPLSCEGAEFNWQQEGLKNQVRIVIEKCRSVWDRLADIDEYHNAGLRDGLVMSTRSSPSDGSAGSLAVAWARSRKGFCQVHQVKNLRD